jgi:chaperonin GroEL (HSP60 family)
MVDGHSITSLHQLDKFYKKNTISDKNNFLIEMNLIDSLKSVVSGLQTSSSLTQILLTIDHLIVT